jgi:hypothetical protein
VAASFTIPAVRSRADAAQSERRHGAFDVVLSVKPL